MADCLLTNKSLKRLLLANCDFNLKAIMAFSTNLVYNESLEELVLDRPVLFTKQDEGSDHFSRILEHQRSLRALSLRYHDMNDFGATMLSKGLANNSTLTSINLEWYILLPTICTTYYTPYTSFSPPHPYVLPSFCLPSPTVLTRRCCICYLYPF